MNTELTDAEREYVFLKMVHGREPTGQDFRQFRRWQRREKTRWGRFVNWLLEWV